VLAWRQPGRGRPIRSNATVSSDSGLGSEISKKRVNVSAEQLKVAGIGVKRTATVSEVARGAPPRLNLTVEVENPANVSIYVWASVRAFDYDPATHVLSVHLEERTRELPKGIKVISEHPRTPTQVEVQPKSRATINVVLPGSVRRLTPGRGLNRSFEEDPVGPIDQVDINVQYGTERIDYQRGENPSHFRQRLRAHGDVVQAKITPTGEMKDK
jgi:hypothetical protein